MRPIGARVDLGQLEINFTFRQGNIMKLKKTLLFILFLLLGILLGAVIATVCKNITFLSWLSYSASIGVGSPAPISVDLSIMTLAFGFSFKISVAQILCIIGSLALYKRFSKGL